MSFREYFLSDLAASKKSGIKSIAFFINPSLLACFFIRCAQFSPKYIFWIFRLALIAIFGIDFGRGAFIGKNLSVPHPLGIVFGEGVRVGNNFTVYQNVTIGAKNKKYPVIGDNVLIYPNSVVVGGIFIANGCVIGALSFLDRNLPENTVFKCNAK